MAPRTVADIEDSVDSALAWRRIELQALRAAISDAERKFPHSPIARALARSGLALLYAHWEGFVKDACQSYVDYIAKRRLRHDELNDGLLKTVLVALGKRVLAGDDAGLEALLDAIRRPSLSRARIPKNTIVDTKSNLRFAVLTEIFSGIGFSVERFSTKDKLIDKTLCDGRNSVAHGRDYYPAAGSFEELHREVIDMMQDLRDMIIASARLQHYRQQPSTLVPSQPRGEDSFLAESSSPSSTAGVEPAAP